jgi:hypothetical protein
MYEAAKRMSLARRADVSLPLGVTGRLAWKHFHYNRDKFHIMSKLNKPSTKTLEDRISNYDNNLSRYR